MAGRMIAPCKECQDREVGCHAECERYAVWKEARRKERAKIRESLRGERELNEMRRATFEKVRRKYKLDIGLRD